MNKNSSGNVIRKNILSNYPGAVLYGLLFNVTLMIDSIIAGLSLGGSLLCVIAGAFGFMRNGTDTGYIQRGFSLYDLHSCYAYGIYVYVVLRGYKTVCPVYGLCHNTGFLSVCAYDGFSDPDHWKRRNLAGNYR